MFSIFLFFKTSCRTGILSFLINSQSFGDSIWRPVAPLLRVTFSGCKKVKRVFQTALLGGGYLRPRREKGELRDVSGRHLGGICIWEACGVIWGASGSHLEGIWEASGRHPPQVFPPNQVDECWDFTWINVTESLPLHEQEQTKKYPELFRNMLSACVFEKRFQKASGQHLLMILESF